MNESGTVGSAPPAPPAGIGRSVALIGADGAGKSTVARQIPGRLPFPAEYLYMGVNLEASRVMLPTTRLVLAWKRRRGGRTDMTVGHVGPGRSGPFAAVRRLVRMANWLAEETYRAALARRIQRRGAVVVFDRHFFCDYYANAIAPSDAPRPLDIRIHGWVLRNWYPRPELTLFLDAPPDVLVSRKAGDSIEHVARRREEYLSLGSVLPAFEVVDANRPVAEVVDDVVRRIVAFTDERDTVGHAGRLEPATAATATPGPDGRDVEPADDVANPGGGPVDRVAAASASLGDGGDSLDKAAADGAGSTARPAIDVRAPVPLDSTSAP